MNPITGMEVTKTRLTETGLASPESFGKKYDISAVRSGFRAEKTVEIPEDGLIFKGDQLFLKQSLDEFAGALHPDTASLKQSLNIAKGMFSGENIEGMKTLGLKEISEWKINPEYRTANIRQHAGYAAEVISTARENAHFNVNDTGVRTFRTDDLPETFGKNHQYIDKVRIGPNNEIVERVQTKFVGNDPESCLKKLMSGKYAKYIEDGQVDKIEIPKDYYDKVKVLLNEKITGLKQQLAKTESLGKTEAAEKLKQRISRAEKLDPMLEKSCVTRSEAEFAVAHPKLYSAQFFGKDVVGEQLKKCADAGWKGAKAAAVSTGMLTAGVSLCSNMMEVFNGEAELGEALLNTAGDTALATGGAMVTGFISNGISAVMQSSSHTLISSLGKFGLPAMVVSTAAQSFDSMIDLYHGEISVGEFADKLAKTGLMTVGGALGAAAVTAVVGAAGAPALAVAGAGLAGSFIATSVTAQVYETAKDVLPEVGDACVTAMKNLGDQTVRFASETMPAAAAGVQNALNDFFGAVNIPLTV